MADRALSTADKAGVRVVRLYADLEVLAGAALDAGTLVTLDSTGQAIKSRGTTATLANCRGITTRAAASGELVHILCSGIIDLGDALADVAWDARLFVSDTDGGIIGDADTDSTVDVQIGSLVPGYAHGVASPDKLLKIVL